MSKKGRGRRTPEARIARKQFRTEKGAGIFRYLTPEQAKSREFNPLPPIDKQIAGVSETMKAAARELELG